jgi:RNA polymerase sigma-70 factor (ECF subfamily)
MRSSEVTRLLDAADGGDRQALARLYEQVYGELRHTVAAGMRGERGGHTLQPTALVNEAYLRLIPGGRFQNRRHFFAAAAQAMRRILVDHARQKRGTGLERITLSDLDVSAPEENLDVLIVNDALERLAESDPHLAELATLRFFAGMSIEDTARALDLSSAAVKRDWAFARAWLSEEAQRKS